MHAELVCGITAGHSAGRAPLGLRTFYRSTLARALPALAGTRIVKQVVVKHGGALRIDDTVPSGDRGAASTWCCLAVRRGSRIRRSDTRGQLVWTGWAKTPRIEGILGKSVNVR